jgi:hypothetical protein
MFWQIACEYCGKGLKAREEHINRRVKCPHCRREFLCRPPTTPGDARSLATVSLPRVEAGQSQVSTAPLPAQPSFRTLEIPSQATASRILKPPGTNVSLLLTAGAAAVVTTLFYVLVVWPLDKTYFGQLLGHRSWVQHTIMFLSFWSGAVLVLKSRKISRQKDSVLFDMLPSEISYEIRPDNVDVFREHIRALPCDPRDSFLMSRCLGALDHFKSRGTVQEVSDLLSSQGEIDAAAVDSSYSMVKIFVWAIPILGFIGTVLGIGVAVNGFSESLASSQADFLVIKESLGNVTAGLAVAFDTTFLALVMATFVMFPMSSLQKAEQDMLISVAEYCNENLLRRLYEPKEGGSDAQVIRQTVAAALAAHEADLRQTCARLEATGDILTRKVVTGWEAINDRLQATYGRQFADLQAVLAQFSESRREFVAQVQGAQTAQVQHLNDFARGVQALADRLSHLQQEEARQAVLSEALTRALVDLATSFRTGGARPDASARTSIAPLTVELADATARQLSQAASLASQATETVRAPDPVGRPISPAQPAMRRKTRGWLGRLFGGK